MAEIITKAMLDSKIEYINRLVPGEIYQLNMLNGLYCLTKNGSSDVFNSGHIPKRALYHRLNAYIEGICVYQ